MKLIKNDAEDRVKQQPARNVKGQIQKGYTGNNIGKTAVVSAAEALPMHQQVISRLNELKFCPITKLVDLAKNSRSEKVQFEAAAKLADKIAPSLKSVEIDGSKAGNGFQLNIYYSKNAQEISKDPYNMVLSRINQSKIDQNDG